MLGKALDSTKWLALLLLTVGVALVQVRRSSHTIHAVLVTFARLQLPTGEAAQQPKGNRAVGLVAVLSACVSSGFAGVYFEKILKNTASEAYVCAAAADACSGSLWLRNIQLGLYGVVLGTVGVLTTDFEAVPACMHHAACDGGR